MSNIPPPKPPKLDLSSSDDDDDGDEGWQWWCSYGERWWQWWWCCWRCDDGGDDGDEGKGSGQDIQRLATDSPLGHLARSSVFNETPVFKDKKKKRMDKIIIIIIANSTNIEKLVWFVNLIYDLNWKDVKFSSCASHFRNYS